MIQNTVGRRLTGVVQQSDAKKIYTGVTTDTAEVRVNPETKEISVNVIPSGLLDYDGSDSKKAYPASLGNTALMRADSALTRVAAEEDRATKEEHYLEQLINRTDDKVDVEKGKILNAIEAETVRAMDAEASLRELLSKDDNSLEEFETSVNVKFDAADAKLVSTKKELESDIRRVKDDLLDEVNTVSRHVDSVKSELTSSLDITNNTIDAVSSRVETIETTYATKAYVHEEISSAITLSKKVVDSIDLDNNTVTINGVMQQPQPGFIYLLKDDAITDEDIYKQYTLIEDELTLIGSTGISLEGYATEVYVDQKVDAIPKVDLTPYAKLSDIPDVSDFITQIPAEYVTESELEEKQYLDTETAEVQYASKIYVQTELAKIGNLAKKVVDGVDLENNKIIVDGVTEEPETNVVYLVRDIGDSEYDQYTLINGVLTYIGNTSINLDGYATTAYVDTSVEDAVADITRLLESIKFIDGGTSATIK